MRKQVKKEVLFALNEMMLDRLSALNEAKYGNEVVTVSLSDLMGGENPLAGKKKKDKKSAIDDLNQECADLLTIIDLIDHIATDEKEEGETDGE